jgi:uncharacterized membrane protein YecN with MAPEG domain
MKITALYSSLLILFYVFLSLKTIRTRRKTKIALGHDENPQMLRAIRAHSNFSEYVPLSLFAIFLVESNSSNHIFPHLLGLLTLTGRILHAYGISQVKENFNYRVMGMVLTFTSLMSSAAYLLYCYFRG